MKKIDNPFFIILAHNVHYKPQKPMEEIFRISQAFCTKLFPYPNRPIYLYMKDVAKRGVTCF